MGWTRLCVTIVVMSIWSVTDTEAVLTQRQKRDAALYRRLDSLVFRVENVEVDLRREKKASEELKIELSELKTAYKTITEAPGVPGGRRIGGGSEDLPETVIKELAGIVKNTFRGDLNVLRHGLKAEKERAGRLEAANEFCKRTLQRYSSRFDVIDGTVSELDDRLVGLNTTVVEASRNCSQCSAQAPGPGVRVTSGNKSGQCPIYKTLVTGPRKSYITDLGLAVCERRFKYAYYVITDGISKSPRAKTFVSATIGTGIKIGNYKGVMVSRTMPSPGAGHIHRGVRTLLSWSRDHCPEPNPEERHYLVLTDATLGYVGTRDKRRELSLNGAVVLDIVLAGEKTVRRSRMRLLTGFIESLLFYLRRGDWQRLCPSSG